MTTTTRSWTKAAGWTCGTAMAVRGVLAAAYKGRLDADRPMVTHVVLVDGEGCETEAKTLCRRVLVERLADAFSTNELAAPTCPDCAKRAARC